MKQTGATVLRTKCNSLVLKVTHSEVKKAVFHLGRVGLEAVWGKVEMKGGSFNYIF